MLDKISHGFQFLFFKSHSRTFEKVQRGFLMIKRLIIFLFINFTYLAIGGLLLGNGAVSDWYNNLDKAPWTPPSWVFGAAWTLIMICFAFYMAIVWEKVKDKKMLLTLFGFQVLLNVAWNPIFFQLHMTTLGLVVIGALTFLMIYFLFTYHKQMKAASLLLAPYVLWLIIATSLNAYIVLNN